VRSRKDKGQEEGILIYEELLESVWTRAQRRLGKKVYPFFRQAIDEISKEVPIFEEVRVTSGGIYLDGLIEGSTKENKKVVREDLRDSSRGCMNLMPFISTWGQQGAGGYPKDGKEKKR
jgi:hypothetical protein